jgi:DNA repair protein RadA/Sms
VLAAVLSSNGDMPIDGDVCMAGEVGLSGEIRPVARIEQRISEAQRLGFRRMVIPASNMNGLNVDSYAIELIPVKRVAEAVRELFG